MFLHSSLAWTNPLGQGSANFFSKGPDRKYFWPCGPHTLFAAVAPSSSFISILYTPLKYNTFLVGRPYKKRWQAGFGPWAAADSCFSRLFKKDVGGLYAPSLSQVPCTTRSWICVQYFVTYVGLFLGIILFIFCLTPLLFSEFLKPPVPILCTSAGLHCDESYAGI